MGRTNHSLIAGSYSDEDSRRLSWSRNRELLSNYFEHVIPRVQGHAHPRPEWDECLQPSCVFDSADVYGSFPAELFQYLHHMLLSSGIISTNHHFDVLELWIDHLRVRDSIEALYDFCRWELQLCALSQRVHR